VRRIVVDDLSGPAVARFLQEHIDAMRAVSPPESMHALDLAGLRRPEITFWTMWDGDDLVGCAALRELDPTHAEIKSMRTAPDRTRQGLASTLLAHLVTEARRRGYARLSLETGSFPFFAAARALYERSGFAYCPPFADYRLDPHSVYMTRAL
jgi:putative acetyltransferase